jgi:cysteine desulfurase
MLERSLEAPRALETSAPIYLDFQATTPLDPRVLAEMLPYLSGPGGNPHSTSHLHGIAALKAVEDARRHVAALINATPDEIVFTSGATEANNLIIQGVFNSARVDGRTGIVTSTTEHKAVLEVTAHLHARGAEVRYARVSPDGMIDLDQLKKLVDGSTALVSVMAVNNEIGVLQPIDEISKIARNAGALFHTDAAQAVGKVLFDVSDIDVASISGHKLYGPMGIGAAYVARNARRAIEPLVFGGGQERGLRSGTLPVALCVGFGAACRIAAEELAGEAARLLELRDQFLAILRESGVAFDVNGTLDKRVAGNLNLYFPGVDAEALLMRVRSEMSISTGSACTADSLEPSHVLLALGFGDARAEQSVRIGLGRSTTEAEVRTASRKLAKAVAALSKVGYKTPLMER